MVRTKKPQIIVVIPARGGSKRIPHKNIVKLCGRPLITYTIQAALEAHISDKVLVSTDDKKIAEIAQKAGADVPFLRDKYADHHSGISIVTKHAVIQAEKHYQQKFDLVVQLLPNCPLRTANDIKSSLKQFTKSKTHFQISCFQFGWQNPWWAAELNQKKRPKQLFPIALTKRSQDLPKLFCPSGAVWIADVTALKKEQNFYGRGHTFYTLPWESAVDIDEYDDLEMAAAVMTMRNQQNNWLRQKLKQIYESFISH